MQNDWTPMTSETHFSPEAALAWQGVALALDETPSGRAAYRVKLWPANDQAPTLCLFETFESEAAIAEWRRQAAQHGLPRYIERAPGAVEAASGVPCPPPAPRRRGATLANRRHSHLRRRRILLTLTAPAG
jgi:hypothetical protein